MHTLVMFFMGIFYLLCRIRRRARQLSALRLLLPFAFLHTP